MKIPKREQLDNCDALVAELKEILLTHTERWKREEEDTDSTLILSLIMTSLSMFGGDILCALTMTAKGPLEGEKLRNELQRGADLIMDGILGIASLKAGLDLSDSKGRQHYRQH